MAKTNVKTAVVSATSEIEIVCSSISQASEMVNFLNSEKISFKEKGLVLEAKVTDKQLGAIQRKFLVLRGKDAANKGAQLVVNGINITGQVRCTSFEEDGEKYYSYDNVVALYGSCSYVMKPYIETLAKRHKKVLLMFYKEDYSPITYEKTGVSIHHFIYSKEWLEKTFSSCRVISLYQYNIVTNI